MPKVIAYCPLHYGAEYLDAAIRSIAPFVDKIIMLYTSEPSYGHGTTLQCPETEAELFNIARGASNKVEWHNVTAYNEGQHRGFIYKFADGYDGILAFDADEVFEPADIQSFIDYCHNSSCRYFGVDGYINFWKSFNHACYDGFRPIRYINLKNKDGQDLNAHCRIYHFSTAQRMPIMRYKLAIHGHKDEIRANWLRDIYEAWVPGMIVDKGLHLVSYDLWNAVPFDKSVMPEVLKRHANFGKQVIL